MGKFNRWAYPPNPVCPMCENSVSGLSYVRHCDDPGIYSVVYHHGDEKHFVFFEPDVVGGLRLTHKEELLAS